MPAWHVPPSQLPHCPATSRAVPTRQALAVVAVLYVGRFDATFALLRAKGVS